MLKTLGPALPAGKPIEALRAGLGAVFGLGMTALMLWGLQGGGEGLLAHPLLIAPFGASTYLIFAVPNSPLAQPWSAVVGNTVSALAGIAVLQMGLPATIAATLAVGFAVLAMAILRAMHPPGGAVALATVLAATPTHLPNLTFAFFPVATGTVTLVLLGILWNRATGRVYPFRQPSTPVPLPASDTSLPAELLARTLSRLRLDANLGTEDLARLIEAAESEALTRRLGPLTAAQVMTVDPLCVAPDTTLPELAALFRKHAFKSLPIRREDGSFGGIVAQSALVGISDPAKRAADLAELTGPRVNVTTPLSELVRLIVDARQQVLPVLRDQTLAGLITRSDMIALLSGHRHP
jgi:CBS domain-containing membrane protein